MSTRCLISPGAHLVGSILSADEYPHSCMTISALHIEGSVVASVVEVVASIDSVPCASSWLILAP